MKKINVFFWAFVVWAGSVGARANDTIQINSNQYFTDMGKTLVITNADVDLINSTWTHAKTHIAFDEVWMFDSPVDEVEVGVPYNISNPSRNSVYQLYFTQLPLISITTDYEIVDEPDVVAYFRMIETHQQYLESHIGIQYRGAWSQTLPKKSMDIEFWTDSTGNEHQDYTLLGMVNDDDWNLQAMYNEPLRLRSKINNDLWPMINALHYQPLEPDAINGVRMKYVELFVNDEYRGLYCLGEKVNRKQLKLKKHNGYIRGELYKGVSWGASTFTAVPSYNNQSRIWSGFEYKYPKEEINWSNLYDLVNFVVNASDDIFYQGYHDRFLMDNLVDYFIFLNLLRATDNTGKNLFIAKYTGNDKYFYVPWDLDGTLGTIWDGTNENITDDILSNGFYDRLMHDCSTNGFVNRVKERWLELRSTFLTHDSLLSVFTNHHEHLLHNGVYEREMLAWPEYTYDPADMSYLSQWMASRIAYLDSIFSEPCSGLSVYEMSKETGMFRVYPNPAGDLMYVDSKQRKAYQVSVYNNSGQRVLQKTFTEQGRPLSLGHLSRGLYYVKVENSEHVEVHKIVLVD
ncbi:MAG: CotH kinase family protein [Bacteroidota bacterium]